MARQRPQVIGYLQDSGRRKRIVEILGHGRRGEATTKATAIRIFFMGDFLVRARSMVIALTGVGTFFAQATATGFVSRAAVSDRGSVSGLYLAFYFFGDLAGAAILGQVFDHFGWAACLAGIGVSLAVAALLALFLETPVEPEAMKHGGHRP